MAHISVIDDSESNKVTRKYILLKATNFLTDKILGPRRN